MKKSDIKTIGAVTAGLAVQIGGIYLLRNFKVTYSKNLCSDPPFSHYLKEEGVRFGVPFLVGYATIKGTNYLLNKCFPDEEESLTKENWTERVTSSKKPSSQASSHVQEQVSPSL